MSLSDGAGWVILTEIYNQDEAQLIGGLLMMAEIPYRMDHEAAGEIFGLSIGPLAMIKILVPGERLADAQKILAGDVSDYGEDDKTVES